MYNIDGLQLHNLGGEHLYVFIILYMRAIE